MDELHFSYLNKYERCVCREKGRARENRQNVCACVCVVVGASCYGGTEHVADKRVMVFKEKGRLVKCAPIRHHRLTVP